MKIRTKQILIFMVLEGPAAMVGSAVIGGFILAMIEGVGIMINRYNYMFMPQGPAEGTHFPYDFLGNCLIFCF